MSMESSHFLDTAFSFSPDSTSAQAILDLEATTPRSVSWQMRSAEAQAAAINPHGEDAANLVAGDNVQTAHLEGVDAGVEGKRGRNSGRGRRQGPSPGRGSPGTSTLLARPGGGGGGGVGLGMLNRRLGRPTPSFACASLLAQVWCPT